MDLAMMNHDWRRASGSLGVEEPNVMSNGKWMFNLRNQASHEESHISKCQSFIVMTSSS
jgi:hypothetical protein